MSNKGDSIYNNKDINRNQKSNTTQGSAAGRGINPDSIAGGHGSGLSNICDGTGTGTGTGTDTDTFRMANVNAPNSKLWQKRRGKAMKDFFSNEKQREVNISQTGNAIIEDLFFHGKDKSNNVNNNNSDLGGNNHTSIGDGVTSLVEASSRVRTARKKVATLVSSSKKRFIPRADSAPCLGFGGG